MQKGQEMATLKHVSLRKVGPNPHRNLKTYPFVEGKVAALVKSISEVGLWEGVIARPHPEKEGFYQAAFGHHRLEAAHRAGLVHGNIIVRDDLDDAMMLKFMGRENGEDYNTEFLMLLETWEAAEAFMFRHAETKLQASEVARFLGWNRFTNNAERGKAMEAPTETANACYNASKLIADGIITRDSLKGLAVRSVSDICGRASSRLKMLDRDVSAEKLAPHEAQKIRQAIVSGTKGALAGRAEGHFTDQGAAQHVDNAVLGSVDVVKAPRLLAATINTVTKIADGILDTDATGAKLRDLRAALQDVDTLRDADTDRSIEYLREALRGISKRAVKFDGDLDIKKVKVHHLKSVN
jgi:ParB/RepB/Spo0J family partition protein